MRICIRALYFFFYFVWPSGPLFILLWKYSRAIRTVIIVRKVSFSVHTLPQRAPLNAYTLSLTSTTWSTLLSRAFRVSYLSIRSWKFRILAISWIRPERCLSHHLHKKTEVGHFHTSQDLKPFLMTQIRVEQELGRSPSSLATRCLAEKTAPVQHWAQSVANSTVRHDFTTIVFTFYRSLRLHAFESIRNIWSLQVLKTLAASSVCTTGLFLKKRLFLRRLLSAKI